MLQLHNNHS